MTKRRSLIVCLFCPHRKRVTHRVTMKKEGERKSTYSMCKQCAFYWYAKAQSRYLRIERPVEIHPLSKETARCNTSSGTGYK